ncbi:MAG: hypothetical protein ACRC80_25985 [Waterburya sp.]
MNLDEVAKEKGYLCAEVWHIGIRFFKTDGSMSRVYSKKGLNLSTGDLWVSSEIKDKKQIQRILHPDKRKNNDTNYKSTTWYTHLFQQIDLVYSRMERAEMADSSDGGNRGNERSSRDSVWEEHQVRYSTKGTISNEEFIKYFRTKKKRGNKRRRGR